MKKRNIYVLVVTLFCITFIIGGCSQNISQDTNVNAQKITVTDILGRQVELSGQAKRVVAIGPGALRLCSYFNNPEMIVGVEQMDKGSSTGKPYVMANPQLANLPLIGQGGPNNAPDPEKILAVNPEVIFSTYASDQASADNLQSKTGIPVIVISYGKTSTFDPAVYTSLNLIGKIVGEEQKAKEIVDYMEECKNDLNTRTKDISDDKKDSAYIGCINMKGAHGIESTQGNYSLFNAVHVKNVVDETGKTGSLMIDKEKLLEWNPDKIFIDGAGLKMLKQDYQKNKGYYNTLTAFQNSDVYQMLPYNFYTTNIDTAIADAYYIGKILYPEKFTDINPEKKADEIYKTLLGKELFKEMQKQFGGFRKIDKF
ncbi:iron complex transport system substrate-binding protein [Desulfonispora thiosulfatigenes DSM 11270]|uniref:Iron complex transport system substrate-binding protein n=1 Tax=Desulfonispora thiosulfatigenes DSM 11270 TaxID=656914 RepID=A0A1W1UF34_DESTI|nr:iron ABC transporter substrate-binding protein [Desulfonispora thiosulfatigenes]SMB79680.1 iron complex transport system substrate-binding protein [Desulfonispora thiosulfatigenes DSM 11270]